MSKWGTFRDYDGGNSCLIHVVPVDSRGHILPHHAVSPFCDCHPRRSTECDELMIHNDRERGTDA